MTLNGQPHEQPLLAAEGLSKWYGRQLGCRGVSFELYEGEVLAIVGESGSGKTTVGRCILRLVEPTKGKVYFEGEDLFALDQKSLAEFRNMKLGFVFQFHYLLADFTALENVMMPALIGRIDDAEASKRATEMLEIVGLGDKLKRRPAELSGGEQQRVAVARAVVLRPKLLLADEPTGNLDPHTAAEVHDLFHKLNRELGITLVIATHNEQLTRSVGRALRLHEGKLVDERRA